MVESEKSFSARLAHCLFAAYQRSFNPEHQGQPHFAGLLERAKRGLDPSLRLEKIRFFLHNGELASENDGGGRRAYLVGQVLTLVELGKEVFVSKSYLTKCKISRLKKRFAAIFDRDLSLVSYQEDEDQNSS